MTPPKDNTRDERGVAIMYVAMFLLSSIWLVSLAIDMGKLTVTKNELQRAADAAALAGASCVNPENGDLVQDSARVRAVYFASQNTALQTTSEAVVIDPQADISFPNVHKVRVTVHREEATGNAMTTIFARSLGITSLNLRAVSTAEAVPVEPCDKTSSLAPVQIEGGYSTACGTSYELRVGDTGNFQLLNYGTDCNEGPCAGLSGIGPLTECWIVNGFGCCLKIGDTFVDTEPGNKVGIIKMALKERWNLDTDQQTGICYQEYLKRNQGNNARVVISPIVDTWNVNGMKSAKIVGFAAFFMLDVPGQGGPDSVAHGQFINYVVPGDANSDPPPGPKLFTLRLVQND
ncbi:MAG TPA: pilus assembly protein TadG-related protein [Candidatus Eisenbacteria bacterium]|nr:pilus assembly protein TadG-related protein [Candidatus Eisenbacteria bacterium]